MTALLEKRGRGRPKGSTNRPKEQAGKALPVGGTPAPGLERGTVALCGQGYPGLVTAGPKRIVVGGVAHQLYTGIHLSDVGRHRIGDPWQSWQPKPLGTLAEILG